MNNKGLKLLLLCLMVAMCGFLKAQTLPQFSTDEQEYWYYIQFQRGSGVLEDLGEKVNLKLQKANTSNPNQLWKLVGNKDKFEIISKNGRHIYYTGTYRNDSYRFATSSTKTGGLRLHSTTTAYAPAWEIQVASIAGASMNQWGSPGVGAEVGAWNQNDVNNPLLFVTADELTMPDTKPSVLKEYPVQGITGYNPGNTQTLWYTLPATSQTCDDIWMDYALPIGTGQFGGMIYGGIRQDLVQFNDKTLWEGSSTERGAYHNFGHLYIEELSDKFTAGVKDYYRQLDMTTAIASATWTDKQGDVTYRREYIASYPDQCIVIRLSASKKGQLNNRFYFYNAHDIKAKYTEGTGSFGGKLTTIKYRANFKVVPVGGTMTTNADGVNVTDADEILVILTGGTDYSCTASGYVANTAQLDNTVKEIMDKAVTKDWDSLLADHLADYQALYSRVQIDLGGHENTTPTDQLVDAYGYTTNENNKRILEQLYFQYGRYLLIASSRGVDLPANLQGIWNHSNNPAWQCDMHANINVQMNYWHAEKTNLSELHDKYLNYLYNMSQVQPQWRQYAKDRAGQKTGWVNYTENNIFGHCTDFRNEYVEAGAWSCDHLWQHYRYTLDKEFLQKTAMPVMLSCVRFWMERLVKDKDGTWVCPGGWSPEHGPSGVITAHAQQIVWALFDHTLKAIEILGTEAAGTTANELASIQNKFVKLDNGLYLETYEGNYGYERNGVTQGDVILKEWKYISYAEGNGSEKDHRHLSHLMSLYPMDEIAPGSEYFEPSIRSMLLRGQQSQGWSMGWKINLWARARNAEMAFDLFRLAFRHSPDYWENYRPDAGGVYYNLLDSHAPFQIDGNFGVCAGVAEMLMQNVGDTIVLLPALPDAWATGSIDGLKAEGGFTVSQRWAKGKLQMLTVTSHAGLPCYLENDNISHVKVTDGNGNNVSIARKAYNRISFDTEVGQTYIIEVVKPEMISAPGRERVNINRDWKFNLGDTAGAERIGFDDSEWTQANLPHSFSIPYFMWTDVYHGYGWYRKVIRVDEEWKNKQIGIEFEGSFIETEVYLNGRRVGSHTGGYTSFYFDLTPYVQEGDNVLAVRVNNIWNPRVAPRAGNYQFSGGIYRDVWLNVTDHLRVAENGTFVYADNVNKQSADVYLECELRNDFNEESIAEVKTILYDASGNNVGNATSEVTVKSGDSFVVKQEFLQIENPQLWSPESPYRYKAVTKVLMNGEEVDEYTTRFGIRKMEWTADKGFFLNGEQYYLLGVNVHQDQAGWGDAVTNGAMVRDVQMMKNAGFNCIRGAHYPHDPAFAEACDSLGMILFMETAFSGMGGNAEEIAWGEGAPASSYPTVASDQPYFEQSVLQQLKEKIRTHRNSPSIACWSLCNEPFYCTTSVDAKMKALLKAEADSARIWDPTREVAIGGAQRKSLDKLITGAIAFYNGDGASRSENQNPGVPNMVSGYGSTFNTGDRPGMFDPRWGDLTDGYNRPQWRSGQALWCGFDYGTVGGYGLAKDGIVDYFRIPKRQYHWYVEAYAKGNTNPTEPEWPKEGTPAKLGLSASQTTISSCNGTDDSQILVKILDAAGTHISNSQPVTLRIVSGPGEFPTGRSITFTPPMESNYKEASLSARCDIRIMDGEAAIAFRSYHGGETVIEATSEGLEPDRITIRTLGTPQWQEGVDEPVVDRPYKRYTSDKIAEEVSVMTLADQRPTWSSSDASSTDKANANDGKVGTLWKPATTDTERWWMVSLEGQYTVNRIELTFPTTGDYRYIVEVAQTEDCWTKVIDQSQTDIRDKKRMAVGNFGENITFVKVTFISELAGLAEVRIGGSADPSTLGESFLSGTIIGTAGSWDNNPNTTKEAAFDFNGESFFDGPEGSTHWVGLDLGYGMTSNITGVAYVPRYNPDGGFADRMVGGRFQVANNSKFTSATTVCTIESMPRYHEITEQEASNTTARGRYVRYLGASGSYGNVSELRIYGEAEYSGIDTPEIGESKVIIRTTDRRIQILGSKTKSHVLVSDLSGKVVYQGHSHDIIVPDYGIYIVKVENANGTVVYCGRGY